MIKHVIFEYGWIFLTAIVMAILLAFSAPFGAYIKTITENAVVAIVEEGLGETTEPLVAETTSYYLD